MVRLSDVHHTVKIGKHIGQLATEYAEEREKAAQFQSSMEVFKKAVKTMYKKDERRLRKALGKTGALSMEIINEVVGKLSVQVLRKERTVLEEKGEKSIDDIV